MNKIHFREYKSDDKQFISEGLIAIEVLERDKQTSLTLSDNFQQQISQWVEIVNSIPSNLIIIAEIDAKPCGFVIGIVEPQQNQFTAYKIHGLIQALWVTPENRQQGIGEMLVKEVLSAFAEFNVPYCDIAYHPNNKPAQKFWEKIGFIQAQATSRKFLQTK